MNENYALTQAYVLALTGDPNAVMDWRVIHDKEKGFPAASFRGTLPEIWNTLCQYNNNGYGVFVNINAMDGQGLDLVNTQYIRTHVVDLDNVLSAQADYQRAVSGQPTPHFAVQSSAGKFHIYWLVEPYTGNDFYTTHQRKFAQFYGGDRKIIDSSRVMRVPGFLHLKSDPFLVTCWEISNYPRYTATDIQNYLQHINVLESIHSRIPLGEESLSAPSLDWLKFALSLINPNDLEREEWLSVSAAFKQAGWLHADEATLLAIWEQWCAQYQANDAGENLKLWNSVRNTEVGWNTFKRKTAVQAYIDFNKPTAATQGMQQSVPTVPAQQSVVRQTASRQPQNYGEILSENECQEWFENCYFVERMGEIFSPTGRFMNSTQFNGRYGGKHFIITSTGKTTDEPWKAALRSTCWQIPKVDHVRFLPTEQPFAIIEDDLKRKGLNMYIKPNIKSKSGDVSLWLQHCENLIPDANDRRLLFEFLAHSVKYPGYKIPWAPLVQGAEGIGKTVFLEVMKHAIGNVYIYSPKAEELVSSGSKFNAWMRGRLFIIVNEIKIDERRELIEILKPMITDALIEVQSKGVDQELEDNVSNWLFFSNYKDAIPVNKNGRRYAIFYSALQTYNDMLRAGMDDAYFDKLWKWLREEDGFQAVTYWLQNYPIEKGHISKRAPETTSHAEAVKISRTPVQIVIDDCVEDGIPGFRGGFISLLAVLNKVKAAGNRLPPVSAVQTMIENMGYVELGRAPRPYAQENVNNKSLIFSNYSNANINDFGRVQGYE